MAEREPWLEPDSLVHDLARAVAERGGRLLVVGGWVRDQLLGRSAGDLDLEIGGLSERDARQLLSRFGRAREVGRSHPVWLLGHPPLQISHSDTPDFAAAAARRDLSINSMGWDPLTAELLDPAGGREDLRNRVLRASDPERFGEDPLRVLRVARFCASLEMTVAPELEALCRRIDLASVASERLYDELASLLLEAPRPSRGFEFLRTVSALGRFPELTALVDVPQDPRWHPEGCVWTHTMMVVDRAAELRSGNARTDLRGMLAALCHDFGKPQTTRVEAGRVICHGHEVRGARVSAAFLERLRASGATVTAVEALVRHHLAPVMLVKQEAGGRAYRKLARALAAADVSPAELERLARADQLGRTTVEAQRGEFAAGDRFLEEFARHGLSPGPADRDVVQGRHVLARGIEPGPEVARVLERCREYQDETGTNDPAAILDRVLAGWKAGG